MRVRPAIASDNAALLRVFAECGMTAATSLSVLRDPDFFSFARLQGEQADVGVAETDAAGVVGCVAVARRRVWLAGADCRVAFVQDFRVHPAHRRQGVGDALLGWARTRVENTLGPSGVAVGATLAGNRSVERRAPGVRGLPTFTEAGCVRLHTILTAGVAASTRRDPRVRSALPADERLLSDLWASTAPTRELAPVLDQLEFSRIIRTWPGLGHDNFLIITEDGEPAAFLALWDQRCVRTTRIDRYSPGASLIRRIYQLLSPLHGGPALPRAGETLHAPAVLFPCVPPGRTDLLRHLLRSAANRCRVEGYPAFTIALDRNDPLAAALRGFPAVHTVVRLFLSSPQGAYAGPALQAGRPLHFEPALS